MEDDYVRGRIVTVEADVQSVEREIAAVNSSLKKQISQESRSELLHHRDQLYEQLKLLRQEKLLLLERLPPPASSGRETALDVRPVSYWSIPLFDMYREWQCIKAYNAYKKV